MKRRQGNPTFVFPDWEKRYQESDQNPNPETFVPRDFEEGFVDDPAHSEGLYQMAQLGPHAMDALLKDSVYGDVDPEEQRKQNMGRIEIEGDAFVGGAGLAVELLGSDPFKRLTRLLRRKRALANPRAGRSHFGSAYRMNDPLFRQSGSGQAFFTEIVGDATPLPVARSLPARNRTPAQQAELRALTDLVHRAVNKAMKNIDPFVTRLYDGVSGEASEDDMKHVYEALRRKRGGGKKSSARRFMTREDELRAYGMMGDSFVGAGHPTEILGDAFVGVDLMAKLYERLRRKRGGGKRGSRVPMSREDELRAAGMMGAGHPTEILGDAFVGAGHPTEILGDLMDRGVYPTKVWAGGDSFIGSLALDLQKAANAGTLTTTSPVYLKLVKARGKTKADLAYQKALKKADARKQRLQILANKKKDAIAKRAQRKIALSAKRKAALALRADAAKRRAVAAATRAARPKPRHPMVVRPPYAAGKPQSVAVAVRPNLPANVDQTLPGLLQPPAAPAPYAPLDRLPGGSNEADAVSPDSGAPSAPAPDDYQTASNDTQAPPSDPEQREPAADAPPEENTQEQEPSADSDPETQDAAASAEEATADANDAEESANETTADAQATEEDAATDTSGAWMGLVPEGSVAAKASENSPTGKKLRAGMTMARRARGGNRQAKSAIKTMLVKTKNGDIQAKRDLTAIRAGHQANKQIGQAKRLFARQARGTAKAKRFDLAVLFKSKRAKAKDRFNAAAKMQLCASKGDKTCLADIATINTAAAQNDPTALRAQKNLLVAGAAIPLLITPEGSQKFYLYMKLAERARKGWAQPKERFEFLIAAAKGNDPLGLDAAKYFKVVIPILDLIDGKDSRVNTTTVLGHDVARPLVPDNVKYAARVLQAARQGNETSRHRIKQMLKLAKAGNPQAIKQMGDMAAALAIAEVRAGRAPDPGIVEASEIVARARAGEPEANRTIARANEAAMKGDAQGVAAMTKLSAAATINKASPPAVTPLPKKPGIVGHVQKFFNFYREGLRSSMSRLNK